MKSEQVVVGSDFGKKVKKGRMYNDRDTRPEEPRFLRQRAQKRDK